ncbi:uncharacterized protein LOC100903898 [Galendromus occidentalis]|uniref:Uncharacterized protein LOC100903898 n=1 Tax=Galendromus occidentalis TaxID=34638 RepID=A0AAJ6QV44_9ACAR|nr:uncharacterized protein LOC100903898 [Galendromus occidentalis]
MYLSFKAVEVIDIGSGGMITGFRELTSFAGDFALSYVTVSSEQDAEELATSMVEQRVAACVHIFPKVQSVYRWNGKVEKNSTVMMLVKSPTKSLKSMTDFVKKHHPKHHPSRGCGIVSFPITEGQHDYFQYLYDATTGDEH